MYSLLFRFSFVGLGATSIHVSLPKDLLILLGLVLDDTIDVNLVDFANLWMALSAFLGLLISFKKELFINFIFKKTFI